MKKNGRQSKNLIDKRDPSEAKKAQLGSEHLRQVFDQGASKNITKVVNKVVNSDRYHAKGPGMTKMRSPSDGLAGKFSKNTIAPGKTSRPTKKKGK